MQSRIADVSLKTELMVTAVVLVFRQTSRYANNF